MELQLSSFSLSSSASSSSPSALLSRSSALPQFFNVRYLGFSDANGLWGIKHTRKPVDILVTSVKCKNNLHHIANLIVGRKGCKLESTYNGQIKERFFPIETISYGVQDLIYTRIFAMITVKQSTKKSSDICPFECHAFVCDSKQSARKLTYSLSVAFQEYSRQSHLPVTVDLRIPEENETLLKYKDSEA